MLRVNIRNLLNKIGYVLDMSNPYNSAEVKDVAPTVTTNCGGTTASSSVLINNEVVNQDIIESHHNSQRLFEGLRIRKLTPKECWRLMGFDDEDFDKASKVNSATQLYKQAGNSIVVNVLEAILANLFVTGRKQTKKGIKLW